jgi:hypothetical protein
MKDQKNLKVLGSSKEDDEKRSGAAADNLKLRAEGDRNTLRKREHKALMKSLTLAQMSTASMGKFDRKAKNEPDAPNS